MARTVGRILVMAVLLGGCESKQTAPAQSTESRRLMLAHTDALVVASLTEFSEAATALEVAVTAAKDDPTQREAAREAFHRAMDAWQRMEVLQLGPIAAMGVSPGGEDLRDFVYSWPLTNACRVDQAVAAQDYVNLGTATVNMRGLDALEYLLFHDAPENACPINSALNTAGTWAALEPEEIADRRMAFAQIAAQDLAATASKVQTAWVGVSPDFREGTGVYGSQREAMNALTTALFYVEAELKDMKLAPVLGVADCATATCPELAESQFAQRSLRNVRANLEMFRTVFVADEVTGFDALLTDAGGASTATEMLADVDAALALLDQLTADFPVALTQDAAKLEALFEHVRNLSTLMKTEFITLLDLDLPAKAEGDND